MVEVYEHYRPTEGDHAPGIYRVVGTTEKVALLRVTGGDGRRANTGELRHVSEDTLRSEFETAEDPDSGFSPISALWNLLSGLYWGVRQLF